MAVTSIPRQHVIVRRRAEAAVEAERAASRQAACAASTELSEVRRHASNEAHRLTMRLAAAGKKAADAREEATALAARLQVIVHTGISCTTSFCFCCLVGFRKAET